MWPQQVLEMWSIDQSQDGARLWLELCWQMWRGRTAAQVVRLMVQRTGWTHRQVYSRMRQAVRPLLTADEETLAQLGIRPQKRTGPALAAAVVESMRRR